MNNEALLHAMENKVAELAQLVEKKSGNKNPDYYKTLKEFRLVRVVVGLLGAGIDQDTQTWLEEYSQSSVTGNRIVIPVKEGDNVLDIMDKHQDVKDIWNRVKKAVSDAGLRIEGSVIVK